MPAEGIFIQWPDDAEPRPDALVARSQSDLSHHNVVALRPLKVYVFWASPLFLVPAENWHLHAASLAGRGRRFDPSSEGGLQWEHFSVASDGLTAFEFDSERTYVFYLTLDGVSEAELKKSHLAWPVYVHRSEEEPEQIHVLFPAQPFNSDPHGAENAQEYDPSKTTETLYVFNSDEHLATGDDAQKLVDHYSLHGLIDGGVLVDSQPNGRQDGPIEGWKIKVPSGKDPSRPYGDVSAMGKFHWRFVLPQQSEGGRDWTEKSLKDAVHDGQAVALSVGQMIMLAGDYFLSLDEMTGEVTRDPVNVIKGVNDEKRFACMIIDVACLPHGKSLGDPDRGKKQYMKDVSKDKNALKTKIRVEKVKALTAALLQMRGPSKYSELHALAQLVANPKGGQLKEAERLLPWVRKNDVRKTLLDALKKPEPGDTFDTLVARSKMIGALDTDGIDEEVVSVGITNGHYADLALKNEPHFAPANWARFEEYQRQAFKRIDDHLTAPGHRRHPIPAEAIARTAFGLHFLTDSFSSGHMRVPRKDLGERGALAAKLMHDMDNKYGLWVEDDFGAVWRAYGDGYLYGSEGGRALDPAPQKLLEDIKQQNWLLENYDVDQGVNWNKVKAAAGAAFKQLHYHAQGHHRPAQKGHPHHHSKDAWDILHECKRKDDLLFDADIPFGPAGPDGPLAARLKMTMDEKIQFMHKYVPKPKDPGKKPSDLLENHPPLFLGKTPNTAANAYFRDTGGMSKLNEVRKLCLRWHGVTDNSIELDFSKFYYLALYTKGAKAEGWISEDETELTKTLDALPKA
jgi:hypothetical protein